ncbi:hypothetical protein V9T40_001052 [Parthenolecanium corni]|uniref:Uncharacterized protein n=1 Tax=Parthenolecanium corni TaxID=536013 RepID=A0AAN9Y2B4_9HEMI
MIENCAKSGNGFDTPPPPNQSLRQRQPDESKSENCDIVTNAKVYNNMVNGVKDAKRQRSYTERVPIRSRANALRNTRFLPFSTL